MAMMADQPDLLELLDNLEDDLDDLEESVAPLLQRSVHDTATKLPVADKARLYVLAAYTIESLLFSYLRLNGVNARDHPIRTELSRVHGYVQKIKDVQNAAVTPPTTTTSMGLDKEAAARFIHAALAGNDKYDAERAEIQARERLNAKIKFEVLSKNISSNKRKSSTSEQGAEDEQTPTSKKHKKNRKDKKKGKKDKSR